MSNCRRSHSLLLCSVYRPASLGAMETIELHPWASTPEATEAAKKAIAVPLATLTQLTLLSTSREALENQALIILAECAMPPKDLPPAECRQCHRSLEGFRKARFCSPECRKDYRAGVEGFRGGKMPVRTVTSAHIGSMWSWPEDKRQHYAIRTIGYALNNWVRVNARENIDTRKTLWLQDA